MGLILTSISSIENWTNRHPPTHLLRMTTTDMGRPNNTIEGWKQLVRVHRRAIGTFHLNLSRLISY